MSMVSKLMMFGVSTLVLVFAGCAGTSTTQQSGGLEAIPPLPEGFQPLPSTATGFRSAKIQQGAQTWVVSYDDAVIKVSPFPFNTIKLDPKWYPEEGGADAALCRGYMRGNEVLIRLEGSSDFVTEETRIIFQNNKIREVVKYSLPGLGHGPEWPGKEVPYEDRVKRQVF